jgi:NAD(P)H-hydrate repair Nnr-like enzyme with NAD(P)H-hydrate dehydratase domain
VATTATTPGRRRVERVPALAAELDATIVAKGPGTLVAAPDGRVWVCPLGGPELGSGGTGDVLAGVVGTAGRDRRRRAAGGRARGLVARRRRELAGARTAGRATALRPARRLPVVLARSPTSRPPRPRMRPIRAPPGRPGGGVTATGAR